MQSSASVLYAELRERHVLPFLAGWFGLCWAVVELAEFLAGRYGVSERLVDLLFVAMWAFLPLVAEISGDRG